MELLETPAGQLAKENFAILQLLNQHNVDFFCKGTRTLREAIAEAGADEPGLVKQIEQLRTQKPLSYSVDVDRWPLDLLADYVWKTHHQFTSQIIVEIKEHIKRFLDRGSEEAGVVEAFSEVFDLLSGGLVMHMKKEELMLFPAVKKLVMTRKAGPVPKYGTMDKAVGEMLDEHDQQYQALMKIRNILNQYTPVDGNDDYNMLVHQMQELDADLPLHIHLENNILFPKAVKLASELA